MKKNRKRLITQKRIDWEKSKSPKKLNDDFVIYKLPLQDVLYRHEDAALKGRTNTFYAFIFIHPETNEPFLIQVNENISRTKAVGNEYYVVITPDNTVIGIYPATDWAPDDSVTPYIRTPDPSKHTTTVYNLDENRIPVEFPHINAQSYTKSHIIPFIIVVISVVGIFIPGMAGMTTEIAVWCFSTIHFMKNAHLINKLLWASFFVPMITVALQTLLHLA